MTLILLAIIFGSICLDQLTKWLAVIYLQGEESFPLWKGVLHFTYVENEGAAFGSFSNHRWVFMWSSAIAIVALLIYLFRFCKFGKWVKVSIAMLIGGGIGNMIDRILLGYVVDFIDFTLINFAVFNVADSFVCVGAFMLAGYFIREQILEMRNAKKKKREAAEGIPTGESSSAENPADGSPAKEEQPPESSEGSDHDRTGN